MADLGGAHGYSQRGRITILESLTPADTAAVLVHEFAHELLHQRGDDRPASKTVRETEAEAVAFIVGTAIGIRSSVDATDYIQLYDGNADTLRQSLHRIQATAKTILSALSLETHVAADHETSRVAVPTSRQKMMRPKTPTARASTDFAVRMCSMSRRPMASRCRPWRMTRPGIQASISQRSSKRSPTRVW